MTTVSVSNFPLIFEDKIVSKMTAEFGCGSVRENYSAYLALLYLHWLVNFKSRVEGFMWDVTCSFTAKRVL